MRASCTIPERLGMVLKGSRFNHRLLAIFLPCKFACILQLRRAPPQRVNAARGMLMRLQRFWVASIRPKVKAVRFDERLRPDECSDSQYVRFGAKVQ